MRLGTFWRLLTGGETGHKAEETEAFEAFDSGGGMLHMAVSTHSMTEGAA
jgi:hypothetical protein